MKLLTSRLIKDIKKGGIVIAPRRSGKTTALKILMKEDEDMIISCPSERQAKEYRTAFKKDGVKNANNRIFGPDASKLKGKRGKLILDDCFWHPLFMRNHVMVFCELSSYPCRMAIYNEKGKRLESSPVQQLKVRDSK